MVVIFSITTIFSIKSINSFPFIYLYIIKSFLELIAQIINELKRSYPSIQIQIHFGSSLLIKEGGILVDVFVKFWIRSA